MYRVVIKALKRQMYYTQNSEGVVSWSAQVSEATQVELDKAEALMHKYAALGNDCYAERAN